MAQGAFHWVLGLMSGTSLDGVDAAMLRTDGHIVAEFGPSKFFPYSEQEQKVLRAGLGLWPESAGVLDAVREVVEQRHIEAIEAFEDAELVGFHGQTLAHDPAQARSFQIGRGDKIAAKTGKKIVWDFRTADLLSGGEGAPLAPFFHFMCARSMGAKDPIAFVNIGGVANVTWVAGDAKLPEEDGALLAFDTGPGNALINDLMRNRLGREYDDAGELAGQGKVNREVVNSVLDNAYLNRTPPKSLDRNDFKFLEAVIADMSTEDASATLTAVTAATIAASVRYMPTPPTRWLICGGGRRNLTLMKMLGEASNLPVDPVEVQGFDGDMFEAQAFAYLAMRIARGLPTSAPGTTGCRVPVAGGRISLA